MEYYIGKYIGNLFNICSISKSLFNYLKIYYNFIIASFNKKETVKLFMELSKYECI